MFPKPYVGLKPHSFQIHEGPQNIGYREFGGWNRGVEAEGQARTGETEELLKPTSWTLSSDGHALLHPGTSNRLRTFLSRGRLGCGDLTCLELLAWMNQLWVFPFLQEVLAGSVAPDPLLKSGCC